ncbi:MAG: NAD-dependent epimerase/dehydratase family protein [Planctomycetaceae bacterium]|nr:NAD-dependent epimerase/dehydratase family protein [Planctomycetaceae bacterium]
MKATDDTLLLVTGATGLVGSHVVDRARQEGIRVRAFVRRTSNVKLLQKWDVEWVLGSMTEPYALKAALHGVTHVVHSAAMVGDWGHIKHYRQVNVEGLEGFLEAARECPTLQRFVHISSLGVYPAGHHHGTDESAPVSSRGIDAYTLSKVEAEEVLRDFVRREKVPALALRPGFIYGPRDRTVLPRIIELLGQGKAVYLGDGQTVLNNTYVGNLVDAVFLALDRQDLVGEFFNIRDERLVTKQEFFETVSELGGLPKPSRHIPLGVAEPLASTWEWLWRTIGRDAAPPLSQATVKFLGYNLDFSIEKAKKQLRYRPRIDFRDGMKTTMDWYRSKAKVVS